MVHVDVDVVAAPVGVAPDRRADDDAGGEREARRVHIPAGYIEYGG
jgi:hypothetical protein